MADEKQVLVVDQQFELGSQLGEILQQEAENFHIKSVPSGEEAWLELLRDHFDLLITNLQLPGLDGPELARRAYRRHPDLPVIVFSKVGLEQAKKAVGDVSVFRILRKPLIQEEVYKAVQEAIYGEVEPPPPDTAEAAPEQAVELPPVKLSEDVQKRLEILRADTGALRLVLGTMDGRVPFTTKGTMGLDINVLAPMIARNFRGSADLAEAMDSDQPFSLHYQTGKRFETYIASVGPSFFVALFFDVQSRRSRFGMIWTALQRGVNDLKEKVPYLDIEPIAVTPLASPAVSKSAITVETAKSAPQQKAKRGEEPKREAEPASPRKSNLSEGKSLSFEEAMKQGLIGNLGIDLTTEAEPAAELDLFGDVDDSDAGGDLFDLSAPESEEPVGPRLSFEEAMKQGLVGGDMAGNPLFADSQDEAAVELDLFGDVDDSDIGDDLIDLLSSSAVGGTSSPAPSSSAPLLSAPPAESGVFSFEEAMKQGLLGGDVAESPLFAEEDETFDLDLGADDTADLEDDLLALESLAAKPEKTNDSDTKPSPKPSQDRSAEEDAFWNALVSGNTSESTVGGQSFEDAMRAGLEANDAVAPAADNDFLTALESGDDSDELLDDLWSEESINEALSKTLPGLSLDEARQQGLLDKK